jgi:ribulose 1,5-bisphosphate carboxylase large subunit-like protein
MSRFEFVDDEDLMQAIRIMISECFTAMNIANALAGSQTKPWKIVRSASLIELVKEAVSRKISLRELKSAVDNKPFMETKAYAELQIKENLDDIYNLL